MVRGRGEGRLWLFYAGNVLFGSGLIVHGFSFNFYLREIGHSPAVMGYQVTAMTVGGLLALMPAGVLIDRVGTRATMMVGVALATLGLALTALTRNVTFIVMAAVIVGAGGASCRVTWGPAVMRLALPEQRARVFTWNVAILIGSSALWHYLAGALPTRLTALGAPAGLSGTQVVLLLGAALTAMAIPCYWTLPFAPAERQATPLRRTPALPVEVRALIPAVAFWMLALDLVQPFFNVFFADRFARPVAWIGTLFATTLVVRAIALAGAGEVAKRLGPERALTLWMLAAAPSLIALAVTRSLPVAVGLFVVQGFVAPATNPLIDQLLLERVRPDQYGVVAAWRNAAAEVAGAVGATVGGHLLASSSFTPLLLVAGGVAALSCVVLRAAFRARPAGSVGSQATT